MKSKSRYATMQGERILTFLKEHMGEHVTADIMHEYLKAKGASVGQTTIYRNLDKLVKEGVVIKYAGAIGDSACYQYIGHQEGCQTHYHLICAECGEVIHLQCEYLDAVTTHLLNSHHFNMDKFKTVIYGLCKQCETAREEKKNGDI